MCHWTRAQVLEGGRETKEFHFARLRRLAEGATKAFLNGAIADVKCRGERFLASRGGRLEERKLIS